MKRGPHPGDGCGPRFYSQLIHRESFDGKWNEFPPFFPQFFRHVSAPILSVAHLRPAACLRSGRPGPIPGSVLTTSGTSRHAADRLRALRATGLLEAESVHALDRLTRLAARMLAAPTALVSLVGEDRQRFASAYGLSGELAETRETPLS